MKPLEQQLAEANAKLSLLRRWSKSNLVTRTKGPSHACGFEDACRCVLYIIDGDPDAPRR